MFSIKTTTFLPVCALVVMTSCTQNSNGKYDISQNSSQLIGAVAGALGGGLLANSIGDGNAWVTIAGTAAGALLGNELARLLSPEDQEAVVAGQSEALGEAKDGQAVQVATTAPGTSATVTPRDTRQEERQVAIIRSRSIETPTNLDLIGKTYAATSDVKLRAAPSTESAVVGSLKAGQQFTAIGQVSNRNWVVVGDSGKAIGYVSADYTAVARDAGLAPVREAYDLDAMEAKVTAAGYDLDSADSDVIVETVEASTECRTLDVSATTDASGTADTELTACKGGDGAWEII